MVLPQTDVLVLLADGAGHVERRGGGVEEDGLNADSQVGVDAVGSGRACGTGGDDFADSVRSKQVRGRDQVVRVPHVLGRGGQEGDRRFARGVEIREGVFGVCEAHFGRLLWVSRLVGVGWH